MISPTASMAPSSPITTVVPSESTMLSNTDGVNGDTPTLRASLARDGFVLLPNFLSAPELESARRACQEATDLARAGKWPYIRTVPKQFPPWPTTPPPPSEGGIWGVQHLMHPDIPGSHWFATMYFDPKLTACVKEILDCEDEDLVMELFNLLVRPDRDFELRWHRDDIPATATAEEERAHLRQAEAFHTQWNLALYDDESLIVVPGSHKRARTDFERSAGPYEADIPDRKVVKMAAGDLVFYDNNILHRGVYKADIERMSLHGSMGHVKASRTRARNVLQHGVGGWVEKCDFSAMEGEQRQRAEAMRRRLVKMGSEAGDVGYFAENE